MFQVHVLQHSIMVTITSTRNNEVWRVTWVYSPQDDPSKLIFLQELRQIKLVARSRWALLGDFNLIYRAADKNRPRVNKRMMNQFRTLLDELEVKELQLHGRRFTWTSGTASPTQTKIDHVFVTKEWELAHLSCYLQALDTSVSDNCPMLLNYHPFH
jgi:endonuclease/exonuclease/phosphatase family metal-dependent hydrolase